MSRIVKSLGKKVDSLFKNKCLDEIFEQFKTKYIVLEVDETENWSDAVKAQINKAYQVYLCINEPTYLGSATRHYPLHPLYISFERKDEFENSEYLNETEIECFDETIEYQDKYFVPERFYVPTGSEIKWNDGSEFEPDEIIEYFKCNHVF